MNSKNQIEHFAHKIKYHEKIIVYYRNRIVRPSYAIFQWL
jgi:hypothetical protein